MIIINADSVEYGWCLYCLTSVWNFNWNKCEWNVNVVFRRKCDRTIEDNDLIMYARKFQHFETFHTNHNYNKLLFKSKNYRQIEKTKHIPNMTQNRFSVLRSAHFERQIVFKWSLIKQNFILKSPCAIRFLAFRHQSYDRVSLELCSQMCQFYDSDRT